MTDLIKREDVLNYLQTKVNIIISTNEMPIKEFTYLDGKLKTLFDIKEKINQLQSQEKEKSNDCDCKMFIGGSGKLCPKCKEKSK